MSIPYDRAKAGDKALEQLQRILEKFNCSAFGVMQDLEDESTTVQFKWDGHFVQLRASWGAYAAKLAKSEYNVTEKHIKQARISVLSALRDWVKGQITTVECGLIPFEEVFMPQILLPGGKRLIDSAKQLCLPKEEK